MADPTPTIRNQRLYTRYQCEGSAEFCTGPSDTVAWATLSEISLGGCYLETASPVPQGRELKLKLTVLSQSFEVEARVMVAHPMFGMGIMFTGMSPEARVTLRSVIAQLAEAPPATEPAPAAPTQRRTLKLSRESAVAIVQEIARHFAANRTLTAQQFMSIVEQQESSDKSSS